MTRRGLMLLAALARGIVAPKTRPSDDVIIAGLLGCAILIMPTRTGAFTATPAAAASTPTAPVASAQATTPASATIPAPAPAPATAPAPAPAPPPALTPTSTTATIAPVLAPDRLGAKAALTFTIQYTGGTFGVPAPVRSSVLRLPAGMSLDVPSLRSCSAARLRARGAHGCPAQSQIGIGHARAEVHAGSENIGEDATLWAFLGPPRNLQPTFEILAQGYTPIDERLVLIGTVLAASPPYGEELELSIPPIPTLALEPDASVVTFSLTIGAVRRHEEHAGNAILTPSSCPADGWPFAAEFTYADGSAGDAVATTPCPQ